MRILNSWLFVVLLIIQTLAYIKSARLSKSKSQLKRHFDKFRVTPDAIFPIEVKVFNMEFQKNQQGLTWNEDLNKSDFGASPDPKYTIEIFKVEGLDSLYQLRSIFDSYQCVGIDEFHNIGNYECSVEGGEDHGTLFKLEHLHYDYSCIRFVKVNRYLAAHDYGGKLDSGDKCTWNGPNRFLWYFLKA